MKFSDLQFQPHSSGYPGATQAKHQFPNGFGVSVITGSIFYTSPNAPYAVAILDKSGHLCYTTWLTNDVLGYQTEKNVQKILEDIEALEPVS